MALTIERLKKSTKVIEWMEFEEIHEFTEDDTYIYVKGIAYEQPNTVAVNKETYDVYNVEERGWRYEAPLLEEELASEG